MSTAELTRTAATVAYVNPDTAARWLGANGRNRNMRNATVAKYARDMTAGNWQFTGEAIKFDINGNLLDGQHRLMAIMQSGTTLPMLIVNGLPPESQDVMDSGDKRTAGDALRLNDVKNYILVAAIARLAIQLETGADVRSGVTHAEIKAWVDDNDDVHNVASAVSSAKAFIPISPAPLGYSWLILSRANPQRCGAFFDALANNSTSGKGDPRNTLLRRFASARQNKEHLPRDTQVNFILRAWNAWAAGEELHILKAKSSNGKGGATKVTVPRQVSA